MVRGCESPKIKKTIVIDPGHGLTCPSVNQQAGAVGVTKFSTSPSGFLREDDLTMAIASAAQAIMSSSYNVILTKKDVNSCPTFKERGRIANNANAKAFISVHINAPRTILDVSVPFGNGTSALYNSAKPASVPLADQTALSVASNVGVNNRGSSARDDLAVLKPTVTKMTAVLVEVARLSGTDEQILHAPGSAAKAAAGIKAAVDAAIGK
ncbi:MAG: hypothetical protein NVS3B3_16560 [Aquirhabdus sp.]